MDDKSAQILFNYLKDIIYSPQKAELDLSTLPEDCQTLGQGMQFLAKCALEQKVLGDALSHGVFTTTPPSIENGLAQPLKEVQGFVRHLEFQAKQVAAGDYKQRLDFAGDLSDAFNLMVEQLQERTEALVAARERAEETADQLQSTHELVMSLAFTATRWIIIIDVETNEVLFRSQSAEEFMNENPIQAERILSELLTCPMDVYRKPVNWERVFTLDTAGAVDVEHSYEIDSHYVPWEGHRAIAHILDDVTEAKAQEKQMEELAFQDALTGAYNRRFGMNTLNEWYAAGYRFAVAFIDIDYLKYCNDEFGHEEGDSYIKALAAALNRVPDEKYICRQGGDEFMILKRDINGRELTEMLEGIREDFGNEETPEGYAYRRGFSFGVVQIDPLLDTDLSAMLGQADAKMYEYKTLHKTELKKGDDSDWVDSRIS